MKRPTRNQISKARVQAGVPSGGQFATQRRDEASVGLEPPELVEPSPPPTPEEVAYRTENIEAWSDFDSAPGEIIEDPSQLEVGELVYVKGHGRIRKAVVTKVGRKNATAIFTTPGSVEEASRLAGYIRTSFDNRFENAERAAAEAGDNYDHMVERSQVEVSDEPGWTEERVVEGIRREAREFLERAESREAHMERNRQASLERAETQYQTLVKDGLFAFTNFTNATVKPGAAKRPPN